MEQLNNVTLTMPFRCSIHVTWNATLHYKTEQYYKHPVSYTRLANFYVDFL